MEEKYKTCKHSTGRVGVLIGDFGVIAWALSAVNKDRGEKDDRDQAGKGNGPESY